MKKIITLCLLLALLCPGITSAQVSLYTYTPSVGTYTPITGTVATVSNLDEGVTGVLPIGFSFWYDGATYTTLSASTNGAVKLGGAMTTASDPSFKNLGFSSQRPMLAVLTDNHALTATDGMRYETSGTAPNRVFTLQWSGVKWGRDAASAGIEFQVKLYEGSNRIDYVYNPLSGPLSYAYATVGISTLASGYDSYMTVTNSTLVNGVSFTQQTGAHTTKPVNGQVYTFTPPAMCTTPPDGGTALSSAEITCAGTSFTLSVANTPTTYGLTFQWQSSADGSSWQNITGATAPGHTLTQSAAAYYRRAITCSGTTAYSAPVLVKQGGGAPVYAALPYTQNFEHTWESNCATRDMPSEHWRNSVAMGNRSWRRQDDGASASWESTNGWYSGGSGHAARFHARVGSSSSEPRYGNLDLYIDCSGPGTKELRFRHIQSAYYAFMTVLYSTDGGATFTSLGKITGINQWRAHQFLLPSTSATTVVRFQGEGQSYSGSDDIGLDDVQVLNVACTYPTGLHFTAAGQTSITANWSAIDGVAGYEYAVTNSPHPPTSGFTATTATSVAVTGLAAATNYYLHVRAKCNATEYSSWATQPFTTSVDCATAASISCGTPLTVSFDYGYGKYDLNQSDPGGSCGYTTLGQEKLFRFAPTVTGAYSLKVSSSNSSNSVYYYLKDAAGGCAPMGWTCLTTTAPNTYSLGTLTAGKEYFIMVDLYTIVNAHTRTLEIVCPPANADCAPAAITPATATLCGGNSVQLATSGGTAYQWYRDGVAISGATAATYEATVAGSYRVAITNGSCTAVSTNASVVNGVSVPVVRAAGATSFCAGGSVVLSTDQQGSYQWYKDAEALDNATGQTFTATESGVYTVKVTRDGCQLEATAGQTVTVNPLPATPVVTANSATTVCAGEQVSLATAAINGYTYTWQKDGADLGGTNVSQLDFIPSGYGSYTVKVTTAQGCSAVSAATLISVKARPTEPVITAWANTTTVCQGGTVELRSSYAQDNQWYLDGQPIAGAQAMTYNATRPGSYHVVVTRDGCSSRSESKTVTVIAPPVATITAAGSTELCTGGSVVLQATADIDNNNTYQWYHNGIAIEGATTTTYTATTAGRYIVAIQSNGCTGLSPVKEVTVNPLPAKPVISAVGNELSASGTGSFQWYLNGTAIAGATAAQHTAGTSGQYTVQVTKDGCSTLSDAFSFVMTAIVSPEAWNHDVVVYPNPVQDYVRITNSSLRKLQVKLVDVSGRVIYEGSVRTASGSIHTKKLAPGSYWLVITDEKKGETITKALVKP